MRVRSSCGSRSDPIRLARYRLTMSDVAAALEQAPFDTPAGSFRSDAQELLVRAEANAADPALIANVVVRDEGDHRRCGAGLFCACRCHQLRAA